MTPLELLINGKEILDPVFELWGFRFELRQSGRGIRRPFRRRHLRER